MPRPTFVPVTPEVVAWAMRESRLSVDAIAEKTKSRTELVDSWVSGAAQPTQTQFADLCKALGRPSSVFFLPKPPTSSVPGLKLRGPVGNDRAELDAHERQVVKKVASLQRLLRWLLDQRGTSSVRPQLVVGSDPEPAAGSVRQWLGISDDDQESWRDGGAAWGAWRSAIERAGVYVLQEEMGRSGLRAFALPDALAPVIAVNSAFAPTVRSFSVFHEVAHVLAGRGSACRGFAVPHPSSPRAPWLGIDIEEELWCDQFAACVLIPRDDFSRFLIQRFGVETADTVEAIGSASAYFNTSARATAIRAIRLGWAPWAIYQDVEEHWRIGDFPVPRRGGRGERRPSLRMRELGRQSVSLVLEGVERGQLSELDAIRTLRVTSHDYDELAQAVYA